MWQTISEIPVVKRRTRRADKDAAAKRTEALRQGGQMRGGKADRCAAARRTDARRQGGQRSGGKADRGRRKTSEK